MDSALKIKLTRANSWRRPRFVLDHVRRWAGRLVLDLVLCWSPQLFFFCAGLYMYFLSFLFFQTLLPITGVSPQSLFDGVRLRLQKFPRIQWAIFVAGPQGVQTLCFIGRQHDQVDIHFDEV